MSASFDPNHVTKLGELYDFLTGLWGKCKALFATKSELPTKTSDLTNDSGFITSSDIPAQQQANWNESDNTKPSFIQNKPSIPAAQVNADWDAVSGVAQILNKPTIPAAQVNSDWNATSGVAEILNKPNLATVATTGSYNDLLNTPALPDGVPTVTSSDDGKVLTATYSGGAGSYSWQTGGSGSSEVFIADYGVTTHADLTAAFTAGKVIFCKQTGSNYSVYALLDYHSIVYAETFEFKRISGNNLETFKVNNADIWSTTTENLQADWNTTSSSSLSFINNKPTIPTKTSDLTNDSNFITLNDVPAQVQSDWNETNSSDPAYIKNKPTIPTIPVVDVEYNGSSVVNAQGVAEIPAPSYPVTDVTLDGTSVVSSGVAVLTSPTVDQTYNSSSSNAQSGTAVAGAIATVKQVPASVAADEGKVLIVNSSGNAEWDNLPEELFIFTSGTAATDATNIAAAITAGKKVFLRIQDGNYYYDLPLVFWRDSETFKFTAWADSQREFIKTLNYSNNTWTWSSVVKKTVVPDYGSGDAEKILTVNSTGTSVIWDDLATAAQIQAIVV